MSDKKVKYHFLLFAANNPAWQSRLAEFSTGSVWLQLANEYKCPNNSKTNPIYMLWLFFIEIQQSDRNYFHLKKIKLINADAQERGEDQAQHLNLSKVHNQSIKLYL